MSFAHAYGAFLGVLCADAAGATLEFSRVAMTPALVADAMRMPGGGIWSVGKGQTTDDSELALSLAHALVAHSPHKGLPLDAIASKYHEWWSSKPRDIGNTCRNAFGIIADVESTDVRLGAKMVARSAEKNATSEANGSLMRIISLAIWGSKLPDEQLVSAAREEATLSHPHQICQDCNAVYCLLVAHLLNHPGDRDGALQKAEAFVQRDDIHPTVREWFLTESLDASAMNTLKAKGHARWAFALAVYHLRQNASYERAIQETLLKGGDTDTNAAIVGGVMGALHGVDAIPEYMRLPVLAFDCSSPWVQGNRRPAAYRSSLAEELTRSLLVQANEQEEDDDILAANISEADDAVLSSIFGLLSPPRATSPHSPKRAASTSTPAENAYGVFLGVLCGDAAGATLEFARGAITRKHVIGAMRMPGGGIWRVGEGQTTDDSELALSLARALVDHAPRDGLPLDAVANKYREWFSSQPFDIGNTCGNAFGVADAETETQPLGVSMVARSAQWNSESQANGSLMRIVPLAIWGSKLPDEQLIQAARQEATLSHPHQICQDCNAVYCLLVTRLILYPGDRDGALEKAEAFVARDDVHPTVRAWFLTESRDASALDCRKDIGHVRWAFTLAVYHLRHDSSYEHAIEETLLKGGDTDTNAAIVGGLMGALHGVEGIPEFMRTPVLAFDCTMPDRGRKRPAVYRSSQVEALTCSLLQRANEAAVQAESLN